MRETAFQGRHTGGIPPLGYDVDPETKKYIINKTEAEAVEQIFSMYINGLSYTRIIEYLERFGYRSKPGRSFVATSIYEILRNQKNIGTFVFNRAVANVGGKRNNHISKKEEDNFRIPGVIPAIISEETFKEVQRMMAMRKHAPAATKAKEIYLLTGLVECGKCGGALVGNRKQTGRNKEIYSSYERNSRKRLKNCDMKAIGKNPLDHARKQLAIVDQKNKKIVEAISEGMFQPAMKKVLLGLETQKASLVYSIEGIERRTSVELTEEMI